jgi:phosphoribosyl 1,2-cyclic phosphodiesterase
VRICALGSGSRGNATLVDSGKTRLLIDCGFAARELEERAGHAGFDLGQLDAILVTHEHGDHIRGVGAVARRYDVPVYATRGSLRSGKCGNLPQTCFFSPHEEQFTIGDIVVNPVAVPHDAAEPCQYIFSTAEHTVGILTDLGCITPLITEAYKKLDMLLLECNHDAQMLADGPYPPALQARVGGNRGHLNNFQAMSLLENILTDQLQHLVLGHLSEKNNHPERVLHALDTRCDHLNDRATILQQDNVSDWFEI